jgi:uncharacterized membrane protein
METPAKPAPRLQSIDALRGTVMIIMAIDHIRDFFHAAAMSSSPTDLDRTTPILFFTRWITHYCLPTFMFTAGMGIFLWWHRGGHTRGQLSRFLITRGLWFMLLELTVMKFAYDFRVSTHLLTLLLILWIFGLCMLLMSALIHLPLRLLAALSVAGIAMHNLLDGIDASRFGHAALVWKILHEPGIIMIGGHPALSIYPLLPWCAVMAAGFCFGHLFTLDAAARQRIMLRIGLAAVLTFVVLRAINRYGDPEPWSHQRSAVFTLLSFLNCTKYPGSLDFVLMTLGPAIVLLAIYDRRAFSAANPLVVFGRVPLFYFVLHFYFIHALAVLMALLRYGRPALGFIFNPMPSMGGPGRLYPPNFGYSLWVTYAVWIFLIALLYPLCRWYAKVKATHTSPLLSYL